MYRVVDNRESLAAVALIQRAISARRVVVVSHFKHLRGADGKPRWFAEKPGSWVMQTFGRRPMLCARPSTLTGEPVLIGWTEPKRKGDQPHPYVRIIAYGKPGKYGAAMRTVRLDRVAIGSRGLRLRITDRPFTLHGSERDPSYNRAPKRPPVGAAR